MMNLASAALMDKSSLRNIHMPSRSTLYHGARRTCRSQLSCLSERSRPTSLLNPVLGPRTPPASMSAPWIAFIQPRMRRHSTGSRCSTSTLKPVLIAGFVLTNVQCRPSSRKKTFRKSGRSTFKSMLIGMPKTADQPRWRIHRPDQAASSAD